MLVNHAGIVTAGKLAVGHQIEQATLLAKAQQAIRAVTRLTASSSGAGGLND